MSRHVSTERMNELLDGLLSYAQREPAEEHLEACASCRNDFARLSETVTAVGALPRSADPPEGTWEAIAERLEVRAPEKRDGDVPVYRLPTAARSEWRISFSLPELAVAATIVALLSAALVWTTIGGGGMEPDVQLVTTGVPGGAAARAVSLEGNRYVQAVASLERILDEGRTLLAPETLVTIEESLATLNEAIADIEAALADDPGSDLLLRMLSNHQRTKLSVLQRAASAVQAQS